MHNKIEMRIYIRIRSLYVDDECATIKSPAIIWKYIYLQIDAKNLKCVTKPCNHHSLTNTMHIKWFAEIGKRVFVC